MSRLYYTLRNLLIFFFITEVFAGALVFGAQTFMDKFILGLVFGFILTFSGNVLKFFKLPVSVPSVFLLNLVISFVLFLILHSPLNFIRVEAKTFVTGISLIDPVTFSDTTMGIVILSFVTAALVSLFDFIHEKS